MAKWFWDDGAGYTWTMAINPASMDSVIKARNITVDRTTAGAGVGHFWEGLTPAQDWGFKGTVLEESEYNQLVHFFDLDRRFYVTLHRGDRYKVTMRSLRWASRRNLNNYWTFDYEARCVLYEEG